jgi:tryptophanyl-tRNA synthetase
MSRINLTDGADAIVKKIQKAKTDAFAIPGREEDLIGRPEAENLLTIYASLTKKTLNETLNKFEGSDFKKLKSELADILVSDLKPISIEINKLLKDEDHLIGVLREGSKKAKEIAEPILEKTYDIIGMIK